MAKNPQVTDLFRAELRERAASLPSPGPVSPSQSLHPRSAGKQSGLLWLLKLSALSAGKALKLGRVLPGHQGFCWTADASDGHFRTFCMPWHHRAACSCESFCPFRLHLSLSAFLCSPFPLVFDSLPHSHLHEPGRDPAAPGSVH